MVFLLVLLSGCNPAGACPPVRRRGVPAIAVLPDQAAAA